MAFCLSNWINVLLGQQRVIKMQTPNKSMQTLHSIEGYLVKGN